MLGEHEVRVRLRGAAAHATFELVHLRQAQPLRVLDDKRIRVRVVDTRLNDGSGHQHIKLASRKLLHHLLKRVAVHLPVRYAHARFAGRCLHAAHRLFDGAHAVRHVVHLPAARQLAPDCGTDQVGVPLPYVHLNRTAIVGRREDEAHVAHARQRHLHGARNRRCRKREHVDAFAQVLHLLFMAYTETLFLVDDDQAQVVRVHIAR